MQHSKKIKLTNGAGDKPNEFAGATIEMKQQLQRVIDIIKAKDKEYSLATRVAKNDSNELHSQITALAKIIDELPGEVQQKSVCKRPNKS